MSYENISDNELKEVHEMLLKKLSNEDLACRLTVAEEIVVREELNFREEVAKNGRIKP